MKHVTFGAETFKKIMESCGSVVACNKDSRKVLTRICFDMENDQCTAVALDGYKLMKIIADCDMEDKAPMRVLIEPVKIPKNITTVKLHCDDKRIEIEFLLFGSSIGMVVQNTIDEEYVDVAKIIPQLRDRSEYAIAVNPKYMIDCMKAMKDHKSVVLNFGGPIQSIMITPNGPREGTQTGLLLPMRIYNESI